MEIPAGIQRLHERDITATKAFDVEALAALWTDDIVSLSPGSTPVVGKEANLAQLGAAERAAASVVTIDYRQDWKEITVFQDHAVEWGVFTSIYRLAPNADPLTQRHNVIRVLRLEAGEWKVARTIWNESK